MAVYSACALIANDETSFTLYILQQSADSIVLCFAAALKTMVELPFTTSVWWGFALTSARKLLATEQIDLMGDAKSLYRMFTKNVF